MFSTTFRRNSATAMTAGLAVAALLATTGPAGAAAPASTPDATEHAPGVVPELEQAKPIKLWDYQTQFDFAPQPAGQKFTYTTNTRYWSVVAIRPWSMLDVDLRTYADKDEDVLLGQSLYGPGAIDFVATDSNHRPFSKIFPRVDRFDGPGGLYDIQLAQGSDTLGSTPEEIEMLFNVVAVRDTYLHAGETYRITVDPSEPLMDPDVYVVDSLPLTSSTWVKSRSQSMVHASARPGLTVTLEFTAPRDDWYGLVLTNVAAQGSLTVTRTTL